MKLIVVLAAATVISMLTAITPVSAQQKDPACMEKCNRDHKASGGGKQTRGTGDVVKSCVAACPAAKTK